MWGHCEFIFRLRWIGEATIYRMLYLVRVKLRVWRMDSRAAAVTLLSAKP